ncbi:hypothetical protein [Alienimonas sp. DA493]|uniref:hypothetical protein n=1 Tax=Alienimonas sp. DA493 TaxID=3373605 RepID=UPI0037540D45
MLRFPLRPARPALLAALLSAGLLAGCGGGEEEPQPAATPEETVAEASDGDAAADAPAGPQAPEKPISPYGTFRLLTPRGEQVSNLGSLTIAGGDGEPELKAFVPTERFQSLKPQVTLRQADAEAVSFTIAGQEDDQGLLTFEGKPTPGAVVGTLHDATGSAITPAALAPLPPGEPNPGPETLSDQSYAQIVQALGGLAQMGDKISEAAEQGPYVPAFYTLFPTALAAEAQRGRPAETLKELADDYAGWAAGWGAWAEADARRTAGAILLNKPEYRELADAQFAAAVEALPESAPEDTADSWREQFDAFRANVDRIADQQALSKRVEEAMTLAATDAEAGLANLRTLREERPEVPATLYRLAEGLYRFGGDAGREELRELREANPLDPVVVHLLGEAERRAGNAKEARALFAEAASIPNGAFLIQPLLQREALAEEIKQPRQRLNDELEDPDAVSELLAETYRRLAKDLATEARPADEANRTVLTELFTGSQCPPCVAADMATAALADTFPREDLLVIQYHLHIPGPDPLTNADAVARGAAVEVRGTPTLLIDGQQPEFAVGGPVAAAPDAYEALVEAVGNRRSEPAGATVNVMTSSEGERFAAEISAEREEPFTPDHRLHVAVVEDEALYAAPNGVRTHEMLVRSLPTGATGVRPDGDGALSFRLDSSVSDLRDELRAYISAYEQEQGEGRRFPETPLQLTKLSVVAWVEDTTDGRVLQSAYASLGEFPPPAEDEAEGEGDAAAEEPAENAEAMAPAEAPAAGGAEETAPEPAPAEGDAEPVAGASTDENGAEMTEEAAGEAPAEEADAEETPKPAEGEPAPEPDASDAETSD